MGLGLAGFQPRAVVEWDKWACDTIRENQKRDFPLVREWPLFEGDVRKVDYSSFTGKTDIVSGGPPCQPFSLAGKHRGKEDGRDMFPAAIEVIRKVRPRAFILENVKGITRQTFANYFQYILLQLTFPELSRKPSEPWVQHLGRLEKRKTSGSVTGLQYNVVARVLNAADYGVPQQRERVFIVGFRSDQTKSWSFPSSTHSLDSLLYDQWITGEYWIRHGISKRKAPPISARSQQRLTKLHQQVLDSSVTLKPWRTVRDAISDLPTPATPANNGMKISAYNHFLQLGAKVYPGHTGSLLDMPGKTLKAGDHGVPGGENMVVLSNGSVRYLTVRESARLQTFPDGYMFHGSWTETMRQLGNAVPVHLARVIGASVAEKLLEYDFHQRSM